MYISPHPILNLLFWVFLEHGGPLIKSVFWKLMSRQREILGKFGSKSGIFQHCQSFKNSFSTFFLSTLKFSYQPSKLINPEFQEITKKSLSTLNPFWLINPQLRVGTKLCQGISCSITRCDVTSHQIAKHLKLLYWCNVDTISIQYRYWTDTISILYW